MSAGPFEECKGLLESLDKPDAVLGLCTMLYKQMPIHLGIERISHGTHGHEKRVHFFKGRAASARWRGEYFVWAAWFAAG